MSFHFDEPEKNVTVVQLKNEILRHCLLNQWQLAFFCFQIDDNNLLDFKEVLFKSCSYGPFINGFNCNGYPHLLFFKSLDPCDIEKIKEEINFRWLLKFLLFQDVNLKTVTDLFIFKINQLYKKKSILELEDVNLSTECETDIINVAFNKPQLTFSILQHICHDKRTIYDQFYSTIFDISKNALNKLANETFLDSCSSLWPILQYITCFKYYLNQSVPISLPTTRNDVFDLIYVVKQYYMPEDIHSTTILNDIDFPDYLTLEEIIVLEFIKNRRSSLIYFIVNTFTKNLCESFFNIINKIINKGHFQFITKYFVSNVTLKKVIDLIICIRWNQCSSLQSAKELLRLKSDDNNCFSNTVLSLQEHLNVVEWCVKKTKLTIKSVDIPSVFQLSRENSILRVLEKISSLYHLGYDEVMNLLNYNSSTQLAMSKQPHNEHVPFNLSREVDIQMYKAYYCFKIFCDLLIFNEDVKDGDAITLRGLCTKMPCDEKELEKLYARRVVSQIEILKEIFGGIKSLCLQLEVLEIIFSLIFSTNSMLLSENENGSELAPEESRLQATSDHSAPSGGISSGAASSTHLGGGGHHFLCGVFLLRDALFFLRDAHLKLAIGVANERQVLSARPSSPSPFHCNSYSRLAASGRDRQFQDRLARLDQAIKDAIWRLGLLTDGSLELVFGRVQSFSLDDLLRGDDGLNLTCESSFSRRASSLSLSKAKARASHQEPHSDHVNNKSSDAALSEVSRYQRLKLRRGAATGASSASGGRSTRTANCDIVNVMLIDKVSLLTLMLKKKRFDAANQVIQIFDMKDNELAGEMALAQKFTEVLHQLSTHVESENAAMADAVAPPVEFGAPSFDSIQLAATERSGGSGGGVSLTRSRVREVADQLLCVMGSRTCGLSQSERDLFNDCPSDSIYLSLARPSSDTLSLQLLLDMGCCAAKSAAQLRDLLNMVSERLPALDIVKSRARSHTAATDTDREPRSSAARAAAAVSFSCLSFPFFHDVLAQSLNFLTTNSKNTVVEDLLSSDRSRSEAVFKIMAQEALLNGKMLRTVSNVLRNLSLLVDSFTSLLSAETLEEGASEAATAADIAPQDDLASKKFVLLKAAVEELCGQQNNLLLMCGLNVAGGGGGGAGVVYRHNFVNYLAALQSHAITLSKFLKTATTSTTPKGKEKKIRGYTHFSVLNTSPVSTIGRLLFENQVHPAKLEDLAKQLGLNLCHIIIRSCVLPVATAPCEEFLAPHFIATQNVCGEEWTGGKIARPCEVVENLLLQIMQLLQKEAADQPLLNCEILREVVDCPEYAEFRVNLRQLSFVDLDLLTSEALRTVFFINLHTLMRVHEKLEVAACHRRQTNADGALSNYLASQHFRYRVGQLGEVCADQVRDHLLRLAGGADMGQFSPSSNAQLDAIAPRLAKYALKTELAKHFHLAMLDSTSGDAFAPRLSLLQHKDIGDVADFLNQLVAEYCVAWIRVTQQIIYMPRRLFLARSVLTGDASCEAFLRWLRTLPLKSSFSEQLDGLSNVESIKLAIEDRIITDGITLVLRYPNATSDMGEMEDTISHHSFPSAVETCSINNDNAFRMTVFTLEYLRDSNALLATLVSLVSPEEIDEEKSLIIVSDYFAQNERAETIERESFIPSLGSTKQLGVSPAKNTSIVNMGELDIKSYRYQRLDRDFPLLADFLCRFSAPLVGLIETLDGKKKCLLELCKINLSLELQLRGALLAHPQSEQALKALLNECERLMRKRAWKCALRLLHSAPTRTLAELFPLRELEELCVLRFLESKEATADREATLRVLYSLRRAPLACALALHVLHRLTATEAVELLRWCSHLVDCDESMRTRLQERLTRVELLARVVAVAETYAAKQSFGLAPHFQVCLSWQSMDSLLNAQLVAKFLVCAREFDLARRFCAKLNLDRSLSYSIEADFVMWRAALPAAAAEDVDAVDNAEALFAHLDELAARDGGAACLQVCQIVLNSNSNGATPTASLLVGAFALTRLLEDCRGEVRLYCLTCYLGAHMILSLPEHARSDYRHLINSPALIFEQLLMNLKLEWARRALELCRAEHSLIGPDVISTPVLLETDSLNKLIMTYAHAAVEVAALRPVALSADLMRSPSRADFISSHASTNSLLQVTTSLPNRKISVQLADDSERTILDVEFKMPLEAPPRHKWWPDEKAPTCMCCKRERFSMFNRRHHCRRCGRVVCGNCSMRTAPIHKVLSRVCDQCFHELQNQLLAPPMSAISGFYARLSDGNYNSRGGSYSITSPIAQSLTVAHSDVASSTPGFGFSSAPWRLDATDEESNSQLREDFFYEQAPSPVLASGLLDLHTDAAACGRGILLMCDYLSSYMQVTVDGQPNPEVDYPLLIDTMRKLLYNAKLKFVHCNSTHGVADAEVALSRVDLMHMLVQANYRKLPTLSKLADIDHVTILRDCLIQEEQFSLAMNVSFKCGLDTTYVSTAMGMSDLDSGRLVEARQKFSRCLKAPLNQNCVTQCPRILVDIVRRIESRALRGGEIRSLLGHIKRHKDLITEPEKRALDGQLQLSEVDLTECLFYLNTYGCYGDTLRFLAEHNHWMRAAQFALANRVSGETFVEGLLEVALHRGCLQLLLDQMLVLDRSLMSWQNYFLPICGRLRQVQMWPELYNIQALMEDHLLAASTCLYKLYTHGVTSFRELSTRQKHLLTAVSHLNKYLDHPSGKVRRAGVLKLNQQEVARILRLTKLQLEVSQFLSQPALANLTEEALIHHTKSLTSAASTFSVGGPCVLTVLDKDVGSKEKLCILLLLLAPVLLDGFQLVTRILQFSSTKPSPNVVHIFSQAVQCFLRDDLLNRVVELSTLLDAPESRSIVDAAQQDQILLEALRAASPQQKKTNAVERLALKMKVPANMVEAYLILGQLRQAYINAVRAGSNAVYLVTRIREATKSAEGQQKLLSMCDTWLAQHT